MRIAVALVAAGFAASVQAGQCVAHSRPNTLALVELYTSDSQGCTSCPAADRWLSGLGDRGYIPDKLVPVALHVFSVRQQKLTALQRLALVYTPHVLLQGREFRGWGTPAFGAALAKINAAPARARLSLEILSPQEDALLVNVGAEILDPAQAEDARLYLAAYQYRLESRIVLEWQGPLAFAGARLTHERALPLLPGALAAESGVAGFVQNRRTGEVLQALMLPSCP